MQAQPWYVPCINCIYILYGSVETSTSLYTYMQMCNQCARNCMTIKRKIDYKNVSKDISELYIYTLNLTMQASLVASP
jgi:hypothetical protein